MADGGTPLPESWYATPEAWMVERQRIFRDAWQVVARALDLPAPGDYVASAIAGASVFALRQPDGSMLGFRNLCRHQGMQVLETGAGHCERLRCRFHGWTYGLDGALIETPAKVAPPSRDPEATALTRIGAAEVGGFALLALDARTGNAIPAILAELVPGPEPLARHLAEANWKREMEQMLAAGALLIWPNMAITTTSDPAISVVQPRGFARSEILTLPLRARPRLQHRSEMLAEFRARVAALHG
ncbi:MAG: aromatic ring-hydroxylating oxygenase subunit alpha [Acetobacteraceae bacterium]